LVDLERFKTLGFPFHFKEGTLHNSKHFVVAHPRWVRDFYMDSGQSVRNLVYDMHGRVDGEYIYIEKEMW